MDSYVRFPNQIPLRPSLDLTGLAQGALVWKMDITIHWAKEAYVLFFRFLWPQVSYRIIYIICILFMLFIIFVLLDLFFRRKNAIVDFRTKRENQRFLLSTERRK